MRTVGLVLALVMVTACSSDPSAQLRVRVLDGQTLDAVVGAVVIAETPSQDHPFSVRTLLGETGPIRSTAETNQAGEALVLFCPGRPVRIGAVMPGYPVTMQLCEEPWKGPIELIPDAASAGEPSLRVIVEPAEPIAAGGPRED
ncbi:MAG: hypothetical protein ACK4WH_09550 [Phycisphaerales bacterium]